MFATTLQIALIVVGDTADINRIDVRYAICQACSAKKDGRLKLAEIDEIWHQSQ